MYEEESTMKIAILNGSPRKNGCSAAMSQAFAEGAKEAGHEVEIVNVGQMKINGCLACEYCHTKGEGKCIQQDDMAKVMPAYLESDMVVFASPIYYFGMSSQTMAAMQRVYCIGKPAKATKAALMLASGSNGVYDGAIATYKAMTAYTGLEDMGICTISAADGDAEAKLAQIKEVAKGL